MYSCTYMRLGGTAENVRCWRILLQKSAGDEFGVPEAVAGRVLPRLISRIGCSPGDRWVFLAPCSSSRYGDGGVRRRSGEDHRQFAQVLDDSGEDKLIAGAAGTSQPQPP